MRQLKHLLLWLSVSVLSSHSFLAAQPLLNPRTQPQFVNPLPLPGVINAREGGTFTISITQFRQHLGLVDPVSGQPLETTVWGYNGTYPGPTILAKRGVPINVFWQNNLVSNTGQPLPHLLPIDATLHWAMEEVPGWQSAGVPIVTHLHGGQTESASDGLPEAWYTPGFALKGKDFRKGQTEPFYYANDQEAATIWYHDHALGITRLNVYAGLAGYYLITDNNEQQLKAANNLPADPYDMGLAIQDRMFTSNGELFYPALPEEEEGPNPSHMPEFFGDFILVNGKSWPVLEVEPRQYRFRILNGSDSRFYNLFLSSGQQFMQVGTDNGLLPAPVPFSQVLIGTGERKDVVIDFSDPALLGQTIMLQNNARTPFPKGTPVNPLTTGRIMAFKVSKPLDNAYPLTTLPATLRAPIAPLQTNLPARQLLMFEGEDEYDRLKAMLGTVEDGPLGWMDAITENPAHHSTEIWEIYNTTEDAHTIHLHMVSMQLLSRQKFTAQVNEETGAISNIRLLGRPKEPGLEEQGWKDTYIMYPGEVTRIITTFDQEGLSVWHCHILSHEDHEMMRPYFIGAMEAETPVTKVSDASAEFERALQLRVLPNPFRSSLLVELNLQQPSTVAVTVYDAGGNRMQQVFNGQRGAGRQQFSIDGSKWSNGNYFCEIVVNQQRLVRKLVLQQ